MQTHSNKKKSLLISSETISKSCQSLKKLNGVENNFTRVTPPSHADTSSLVFANSEALVQQAINQNAGGLILTDKLTDVFKEKFLPEQCIWTTSHIHLAMTEVLPHFNPKTTINSDIHATAYIDHSAHIGKNVIIEPFAVIGKNVRIGDNSIIGAHSVLENDSSIGDNTQISSHVLIGFNCHIGNNCLIGPQTAIGSDGFGFYTDKTGQHHKIPQIGQVIIEDNCELGAQCAIDRAALTETKIKKGSKFDNFIHIAHNCEIGENAMITAGFIVAGSTKIGKNLTTAGGTHVVGHVHITDNVVLTGRTGVVSSIEKPGIYGGFPHTTHKENLKIMSSLASLPKIRKQMTQILKHLGLNNENDEQI